MVTGKIVRFDRTRGFGFIAPDGGGEDVFLHANELEAEGLDATVGCRVSFDVIESERGMKAYDVQLLPKQEAPAVTAANIISNASSNGSAAPATVVAVGRGASGDDEEWDVLSEREFTSEVTEALINALPTLTGADIVQIRTALMGMARSHGWID